MMLCKYGFDVYAYEDAYIWGRCIDLQFAICNQAQEAFILQNTYVTLRNIFLQYDPFITLSTYAMRSQY